MLKWKHYLSNVELTKNFRMQHGYITQTLSVSINNSKSISPIAYGTGQHNVRFWKWNGWTGSFGGKLEIPISRAFMKQVQHYGIVLSQSSDLHRRHIRRWRTITFQKKKQEITSSTPRFTTRGVHQLLLIPTAI